MLLDTSVIIDILRQRSEAVALLKSFRSRPSASVISIMELFGGARSRQEERRILSVIEDSRVFPVSAEIAQRAGVFLKHYRKSHSIGDPDALIAATAEHHGLELATLNVKHFPMFARLKPPY